jgi:hypothetical protein
LNRDGACSDAALALRMGCRRQLDVTQMEFAYSRAPPHSPTFRHAGLSNWRDAGADPKKAGWLRKTVDAVGSHTVLTLDGSNTSEQRTALFQQSRFSREVFIQRLRALCVA